MIIIILIVLIFICLTIGIAYLVLFFPTKWLIKRDKQKIVRLILSIFIGIFVAAYYLFVSPATNNKTATIEKLENQYVVTMTGKRCLMVHDPISLLMQKTYIDSCKISLPKSEGVILGLEIPTEKGHYKYLGSLTIKNDKMTVDLYYDNYDDKIKDPISWNGNYKLKWRK
jgi:hypothetical protein